MKNPHDMLLFELLHGSHLASLHWEAVGKSGETSPSQGVAGVFGAYPELCDKFDAAADAIAEFYQAVGREWGKGPV